MAKYISFVFQDDTATLYYTTHRVSDGRCLQSNDHGGTHGTWSVFDASNQGYFAFDMTSIGVGDKLFKSDESLIPLGGIEEFIIIIWLQSGANPASIDSPLTSFNGIWNGTDLVTASYCTNLDEVTGDSGGPVVTLDELRGAISDLAIRLSQLKRELELVGV